MLLVSPNTGGIRNYLGMRIDSDNEPEMMSSGLRGDVVRIILENICDPCLRVFAISFLSAMNTYDSWRIDPSLPY